MKYLLVAVACLFGILAISFKDTEIVGISKFQTSVTTSKIEDKESKDEMLNPEWNAYWYAGLAELSGYSLQQSRYGEIHEGQATMIFVTEPFSRRKQVKLDNAIAAGSDKQAVLKLNSTRKFLTGIYPYSMMTSVFSPVNHSTYESAMKLTVSGQEWCGQVFMQMNQRGGKYDVDSYSYFESEGDQDFSIDKSYLEDELYNLIRLNPELLPIGEVEIIPSAVASKFMHEEVAPYKAIATLKSTTWQEKKVKVYNLVFKHNERLVNIYFDEEFPHIIEGWEDTYGGFGRKALTTVAVRKNTNLLDYWNKHDNKDRHLNADLYK